MFWKGEGGGGQGGVRTDQMGPWQLFCRFCTTEEGATLGAQVMVGIHCKSKVTIHQGGERQRLAAGREPQFLREQKGQARGPSLHKHQPKRPIVHSSHTSVSPWLHLLFFQWESDAWRTTQWLLCDTYVSSLRPRDSSAVAHAGIFSYVKRSQYTYALLIQMQTFLFHQNVNTSLLSP